ncbi:MAG: DUF2321 domain-containing protein [Methanoregula sp.]
MSRFQTILDFQQICLNGHQITDSYTRHPQSRKERCPQCGERTISNCQICNTPIKGREITIDTGYDVEQYSIPASVPLFCEKCGNQFPWKENFSDGNPVLGLKTKERASTRKIFIVHGHDHVLLENVEQYLESLDIEPIVLHKQADLGKTIIEKVEHYITQTSFAIVILTKDDFGIPKTTLNFDQFINESVEEYISRGLLQEDDRNHIDDLIRENNASLAEILADLSRAMLSHYKPRARQNVIFELGITIGHLGRDRVRVLYEEDVELPTDLHGLVYIPLKSNWKKKLAKEIDASGIKIDENYL